MDNLAVRTKKYFMKEVCALLLFTGLILTPIIRSTTSRVFDDSQMALKQSLETRIEALRANPDFTNKTSKVYQEYDHVMQIYGAFGDSVYFSTTNESNH